LRVLLALGSDRDILEEARRGCAGAAGAGGRSCELLASGLAARGLGPQALSVLDAVVQGRPDAHSARVLQAEVQLRMGRVETALAAALELAADSTLPGEFQERLARLFSAQRHPGEASRVLETLFARADGAQRDGLVRDSARLLLRTGEVETAVARLKAWTGSASHRCFSVYRLLVRAGFRTEAMGFLEDIDLPAVEDVKPDLLAAVLSDLLEHGHRPWVDALAARVEGEGSPSARAVMGSALGAIGWRERAVGMLVAVPDADRTTSSSIVLAEMLAKQGDIAGALDAMAAAEAGPDPIRPEVRESIVRTLVIEGAPIERAAALAAGNTGKDEDPGRALMRAILLAAGSDASLVEARDLFIRVALSQGELPAAASEYIRTEARRGTLRGLLTALEAHPGLPARQAGLHAACLLGDKKAIDRVRSQLDVSNGPAGNAARLAAARAWFECGAWSRARVAAESVLEGLAADQDPREAAVLGVIAGRMEGKERHAGILRHLRGRTDDLLVRAEQEASVHLARGDVLAAARAMEARAARTPGDERSWVAVARLAVQAGDDALRSRAQARALDMPIDMGSTIQGFEDGYRAALRDDLAGALIDLQIGWYPDDAALANRRFLTALGGGDDARALEAATRLLDLAGDRRASAAFVVGQGAAMLSVPVVDRFLEDVLHGGPDAAAARAVLNAAVLRFRTGDAAAGFALVERAAGLATDRAGFVSGVGRAALVDPSVPPDVVERAIAALSQGAVESASLARLPMAFAATCLGQATTAVGVEECAARLDESGFHPVPLLNGAAKRAFAVHRYEVAEAALHAAVRRDPSRIFGRMIAVEILEAVGDRHEVRDPAVRRRLGGFALGRIGWRGAVADPALLSLVAQLTEMAGGTATARALLERELAIHPTDASGWNGLAYLLSMAGDDLGDALRFVQKAERLEPSQNGYFLETEGWTWFRKGNPRRALDPQLRASRLWTNDLGTALAESLNHLGRILEAVGRPEEAAAAYRQAFVRGPETRHGHRALARWRTLAIPVGN
jgi:tetratricopeptide (TPR) repeat protein